MFNMLLTCVPFPKMFVLLNNEILCIFTYLREIKFLNQLLHKNKQQIFITKFGWCRLP